MELNKEKWEIGKPLVWADTIQELCEGLNYFKSYQSSLYTNNSELKGLLLCNSIMPNDYFAWDVFITHGGGSMKASREQGASNGTFIYKLSRSQEENDTLVIPYLKLYKSQGRIPVILNSSTYDTGSVVDIPKYSVLGYYFITHVWIELEEGLNERCSRYKFRFERQESSYPRWWSVNKLIAESDEIIKNVKCQVCNHYSPILYEIGFVCFNKHCTQFYSQYGQLLPDYLVIKLGVLKIQFNNSEILNLPSLIPKNLLADQSNTVADSIECKAYYCQSCYKLSSREYWHKWICTNCKNSINIINPIISNIFSIKNASVDFIMENFEMGMLFWSSNYFNIKRYYQGEQYRSVYRFDENNSIEHITCHPYNKPFMDKLFIFCQSKQSGLDFKRYEVRKSRIRTRLLGNQFQYSCGILYQHLLRTETIPLEDAPPVIRTVLNYMQFYEPSTNYNQITSLLYCKGQRMGWHNDSEEELGDKVISLSLGNPAKMNFKFKENDEKALSLYLLHGDILIMNGPDIQKKFLHCIQPDGFRIAFAARYLTRPRVV